MERTQQTRRLVFTAVFAALIFAATYAVKIPTFTGGYVHPGDAVLILGACFQGPWLGALAGGVGSALTDLAGGYLVFVPGTLVIKALMGLLCGGILRRAKRGGAAVVIAAAVAAEVIMVLGYFGYEAVFLKFGLGAAASIPANIGQGIFGAAAGTALYLALRKTPAWRRMEQGRRD